MQRLLLLRISRHPAILSDTGRRTDSLESPRSSKHHGIAPAFAYTDMQGTCGPSTQRGSWPVSWRKHSPELGWVGVGAHVK